MSTILRFVPFILLTGVLVYVSCKKDLVSLGEINEPPIANAGPDQTIVLPLDSVLLDGSASRDMEDTVLKYQWTKIEGPVSFNIREETALKTIINNLHKGIYRIELKVTDAGGLFSKDTMRITVDSVYINRPPIANAGPDQAITLPSNSVFLDASLTSDPNNNITNYEWTKISGPLSFNIINPTVFKTQATNLEQGTYKFEFYVRDNGGLFSKDTMQVIVHNANNYSSDSMYISGCTATLTTIGHLSIPSLGGQIISAANKIFFSWFNGTFVGTNVYDAITKVWSTTSGWVGNIMIGTKLINATYNYPIDLERFEIYDAATGDHSIHEVPESRAFIKHDITDNKLIFAGGFHPDYLVPGASKRIDIYDHLTNSWSLVVYDSASRSTDIAAFDNKIFLFGTYIRIRLDTMICGVDDDGINYCFHPSYPDPKMDIYDMSTKTWSVKYLGEPKGNIRIAKTANKLYFFQEYSSKIDVYDASSNAWKVEVKNDETDWTRVHVVGNKILFTKFWSNEVGIYDITTSAWSINQMNKQNAQTDYLVAITGNKILFLYVFDYEDHSTAIDTYDANTNTWCHGELSRSLVRSAIGVADNKIYIAGGITKTNPKGVYDQFLDNIWVFDF